MTDFIFAIQRKSVLAWADFSKQITFETKNTHSVFLKEKHKKLKKEIHICYEVLQKIILATS